jgi:two-component system, response regulator PdtaR
MVQDSGRTQSPARVLESAAADRTSLLAESTESSVQLTTGCAAQSSRLRGPPLKIAVADDEPDLRDFFAKVLPRLGYDLVAVADSGEDVVRLCQRFRPDLVISDVQLAGMSGPEAIEVVRRWHWVAAVYVAENPVEDEAALQARASVVLMKPFRMTDLVPSIAQAMQLRPDQDLHHIACSRD